MMSCWMWPAPAVNGRQRHLLAAADLVDHAEVGGREDADVLAVLAVDPLDVLGDHDADAGGPLRVGRRLAAGALPAALARHGGDEAAVGDVVLADRLLAARPQADVRIAAERLVEVVADPGGRDLVGADVVAQLDRRVPVEILAGELAADQLRVLGEEEDPPLEADGIGSFRDLAIQQVIEHRTWVSVSGMSVRRFGTASRNVRRGTRRGEPRARPCGHEPRSALAGTFRRRLRDARDPLHCGRSE